jgi:tetratricopeptide (TPR) repeat protein
MKSTAAFALLLAALATAGAQPPAGTNGKSEPLVKAYTPAKKPVPPAGRRIDQAVNRLLEQADVYWHRGEYDNVRATYAIITDLDPDFLDGWQSYGWILWAGLQQDDAAMRVFQRGLAYHPDTWELYFEIGNLEYHRRHFLNAAEWFAKASGHKAPMYVWHMRAHCLEYAGEIDKAKAMWKTIIAKFPDDPPAPANLKRLEEGRIRRNPVIGVEVPKPDGTDQSAPEPEQPRSPEGQPDDTGTPGGVPGSI